MIGPGTTWRRLAEVILGICACMIWLNNLHLITHHPASSTLSLAQPQMGSDQYSHSFPWASSPLPVIRRIHTAQPHGQESAVSTTADEDSLAGFELLGLFCSRGKRGAILRDASSRFTAMILEGEEWQGVILDQVSEVEVRLRRGRSQRTLSLIPGRGQGEKR